MKLNLIFCFQLLLLSFPGFAEETSKSQFEVEAGVVKTRRFEISGYQQGNATNGWQSTDPDVRLEYWRRSPESWNYGAVLQPLYVRYQDHIKSDLNYKGRKFLEGESAKLDYQFHSFRGTANYPLVGSAAGVGELRAGTSLIVRYAQLDFRTQHESFRVSAH
jgi:hypothetical protein